MDNTTLWFRVDGGAAIGLGHVARAMAMAEEAASRGLVPRFVLNDDDAAREFALRRGFADVATVPPTLDEEVLFLADAAGCGPLVTDLRGRDPTFYRRLREADVLTCAFDDMGEAITAHVVVNGGVAPGFARYEELWPPQRFLVGTAYIPLPRQFAAEPPAVDDPGRTRLLVTFGGADADDFTRRALAALAPLAPLDVDLALGPAYRYVDEARALAAEGPHNLTVHAPARDMLPLYRRGQLALSAGGLTQYELLCCGVPTISVPHVAREEAECAAFAEAGAVETFPPAELRAGGAALAAVGRLWDDVERRRVMAAAGRRLIDGRGAVRVLDVFLGMVP